MPPVPSADADPLVLGAKLTRAQGAAARHLGVDGADVSGVVTKPKKHTTRQNTKLSTGHVVKKQPTQIH